MIIPGVFEQDRANLMTRIRTVENFVGLIQIDLADGVLVNGKSLTTRFVFEQMDTKTNLQLHLMVEIPLFYLELPLPKVTSVCSQIEAKSPPRKFIDMARNLGYQVGLSLNPTTPISKLEPFVGEIDFVQFMTVIPGAQGRGFKNPVLNKMVRFKAAHPEMKVQVDGGINEKTLGLVLESGADDVIIGSAIFKDRSPLQALRKFQEMVE